MNQSYDDMMSDSIPKKLIFNPKCKIIDFDETQTFFCITHLLKMPKALKDIVSLFNGKNSVQNILQISSETFNVTIDNAYIRHLYEQKIIIEA